MKEYSKTEFSKADLKMIIIGDTACGKSKLVERFLLDDYQQRQLSTYALTMYRHTSKFEGRDYAIDIWDTAGQEQYSAIHPSYYFAADCCILVFDVTRKSTYQNIKNWYSAMRQQCGQIPTVLVANKIDLKPEMTKKKFQFAVKNDLPLFFTSAADGTNVVKVFKEILGLSVEHKRSGKTSNFIQDVLEAFED